MPETPFATAQDVEDRWRVLSADEAAVAEFLVADASDIIRNRWSDVDDRITAGTLSAASVTRVVAAMVKRAMLNANFEGLESQAQGAGPFSVSNKFANPNGNLYLTTDEINLFDGYYSSSRATMRWLA